MWNETQLVGKKLSSILQIIKHDKMFVFLVFVRVLFFSSFCLCASSESKVIDKNSSTAIPRPSTKRQFSSPATIGVAHINLSDVVAKINNGPKSCTNPFLNGSLSISEDDNSNSIDFNVNRNQYNSAQVQTFHAIDEKLQKNPFSKRRQDDISFFSFPSNGNIDDENGDNDQIRTTNTDYKITETSNTLIELNEPIIPITTTATTTSITSAPPNFDSVTVFNQVDNVPNVQNHNRSLSDCGSKTLTDDIYEQSTITNNPFADGNLHKTISDTYLEQYSTQKIPHTNLNRTTNRQSIQNLTDPRTNSPPSTASLNDTPELKRAMSCDSVNSESSVLLADLEQQNNVPTVTGQLCVGLQYDK